MPPLFMHVAVFSLHTALLLTHDKARNVFENCSDLFRLCIGLNIPDDKRKNALIATEFFMQSKERMKVRRMIFYLDYNGDTALADTVMEYAEPPAGICKQCLCPSISYRRTLGLIPSL